MSPVMERNSDLRPTAVATLLQAEPTTAAGEKICDFSDFLLTYSEAIQQFENVSAG